ncbi:MAG: adenosylcobinamide-phosphate synthase CbiB [Hyphomicrobiales bacterium]|nr:adenosylcobinamide-phosphate synthase CbiB [Hyphomicrobiales bacterium]
MTALSFCLVFVAVNLGIALVALLLERLYGYPDWIAARIGHPVMWMGALIQWLDESWNDAAASEPARRFRGALLLAVLMACVVLVTVPAAIILRALPWGWALEAALASSLLSQKALDDAVRAVARGLDGSLEEAREAVRHIVGRDPEKLDQSGVARGAIESLAENMSDGAVAPLLWLLVAGLPGAALYKAINTADSMIGYKSYKHRAFGWASARVDDLVNLPASRFTAMLLVAGSGLTSLKAGAAAARTLWRDARAHLSPNAGWPEAAMAGALGIRLGGPRRYGARRVDLPWMGDGRETLGTADIDAALGLYGRGLNLLTGLVVVGWLVSVLV